MDSAKNSNGDALNINSMPEEIRVKVFSYLTQKELGRISRVCKEWNMLAKRPVLWKKVNIELDQRCGSQNNAFESLLDFLPSCVTHIQLNFMSHYGWTQPLNFEELSEKLEKYPRLQMLFLKQAKLSDTLPSVIDLCAQYRPNLKMLIFHHSTFGEYSTSQKYYGIYKFEVLDISGCHLGDFNKLPFLRMHGLKRLCLADQYVNSEFLIGDTSFLNMLHVTDDDDCVTKFLKQFSVIPIPSFLKQLDMLDLGNTTQECGLLHTIKLYGSNLKEFYLCNSTDLGDRNLNFKMFRHLKTICLNSCSNVTCEGIVNLIMSCQSLETVYVKDNVAECYKRHPFVFDNRCKLEIVKVIDCKDHRKVDY